MEKKKEKNSVDGLNSRFGLYEEIIGALENKCEEIIQNVPYGKHESEDTKNKRRRPDKTDWSCRKKKQNGQGRGNI